MKPITHDKDNPGFLEYLEDIIGSDIYIDQIKELEQKLDLVEQDKEGKL